MGLCDDCLQQERLGATASTSSMSNIGALIIRIGLWGPLCCNYNNEPTKFKTVYVIFQAPLLSLVSY